MSFACLLESSSLIITRPNNFPNGLRKDLTHAEDIHVRCSPFFGQKIVALKL